MWDFCQSSLPLRRRNFLVELMAGFSGHSTASTDLTPKTSRAVMSIARCGEPREPFWPAAVASASSLKTLAPLAIISTNECEYKDLSPDWNLGRSLGGMATITALRPAYLVTSAG